MDLIQTLAKELNITPRQAESAVRLIDEGNTIPFIARYRKEATGGLDDGVLRALEEKLSRYRALDQRRTEILRSLESLGIDDGELKAKIGSAGSATELEDLYRPYRPKRRTRASAARERGLEKLADALCLNVKNTPPRELAEPFVDPEKEIPDPESALAGARDIIAERISDDAELRARLRRVCRESGVIRVKAADDEPGVYEMYTDYRDQPLRMPTHRILAMNRGEKEGKLKVGFEADEERILRLITEKWGIAGASAEQISLSCADAWDRLLRPSLERDIRNEMTERAEEAAIQVFSDNLYHLLMQPPIRGKITLGVDPGFRTGCKLAVIDENGAVLDTGVGYFTLPGMEERKRKAAEWIIGRAKKYGISAIAIGNGTASRESEQFIVSLLPQMPGVSYMIVSEAGASVYSASKLGAEEFPEYDVSLRSAVSIARRMQDPLAELVKIDPKSIGVGQYQHDMNEKSLSHALCGVVEKCVNSVGVEVGTASASLLSHVAGIGPALAANIVKYRKENGIASRAELKKVPKLGAKAFEQCAGFLRVRDSREPLDATAVHPESYQAARGVLAVLHGDLKRGACPGLKEKAAAYGFSRLAAEAGIGEMTLKDILEEMEKPGRDPRDELPAPLLRRDVMSMEDLKPGMKLKGTVRNVVDFGAFVDIGVHQDGLVHISRMSRSYIRHPSEAVKNGDVVDVWILETDMKRKRISLTMIPPEA